MEEPIDLVFSGLNFSAVLYAASQSQNMSPNANLWTAGGLCLNPNVTLGVPNGVWGFLGCRGRKKEQKLNLKPLYKKVAYVEVTVAKIIQWLL